MVYLGVVAATLGGLVLVSLAAWRAGLILVGVVLGLAALARLLLPESQAGMLGVRSRAFDVVLLGFLAFALVVIVLVVPDRPPG